MSLVTPDFGLIFWMTLIFGIVLFLLWKFGFPVITDMVEKRTDRINSAIRMAKETEVRMQELAQEQEAMIESARKEQAAILREASQTRSHIIAEAQATAKAEADRILAEARTEIAAEKESALRDVRKEIALLSVQVAEKILRRELSGDAERQDFVDKMVDETTQANLQS